MTQTSLSWQFRFHLSVSKYRVSVRVPYPVIGGGQLSCCDTHKSVQIKVQTPYYNVMSLYNIIINLFIQSMNKRTCDELASGWGEESERLWLYVEAS